MPTNQPKMNNQVLEEFPVQYNLNKKNENNTVILIIYFIPGVPQNVEVNLPSNIPSLHIPKLE
jgi:hypothetical protein